jgi:putative endonuclease
LDTVEKGSLGESHAARYLLEKGYRILGRNQRTPRGELDIVALSPEGVLCFVEVKAALGSTAGDPAGWITPRKVRRLQRAAQAWCAVRGWLDHETRFDAIAVRLDRIPVEIDHIEGAFLPDASGYF